MNPNSERVFPLINIQTEIVMRQSAPHDPDLELSSEESEEDSEKADRVENGIMTARLPDDHLRVIKINYNRF